MDPNNTELIMTGEHHNQDDESSNATHSDATATEQQQQQGGGGGATEEHEMQHPPLCTRLERGSTSMRSILTTTIDSTTTSPTLSESISSLDATSLVTNTTCTQQQRQQQEDSYHHDDDDIFATAMSEDQQQQVVLSPEDLIATIAEQEKGATDEELLVVPFAAERTPSSSIRESITTTTTSTNESTTAAVAAQNAMWVGNTTQQQQQLQEEHDDDDDDDIFATYPMGHKQDCLSPEDLIATVAQQQQQQQQDGATKEKRDAQDTTTSMDPADPASGPVQQPWEQSPPSIRSNIMTTTIRVMNSQEERQDPQDQQQLSPEDLIARVAEQQEQTEKKQRVVADVVVDPIHAAERGEGLVPGAFAWERSSLVPGALAWEQSSITSTTSSGTTTTTIPTGSIVPLEATLVVHAQQPERYSDDDDDDILTAHPMDESKGAWTAQIWCRYSLAGLCLLTVLALCIYFVILAERGKDKEQDDNLSKFSSSSNNNTSSSSSSWYSHHGVALGSHFDCPSAAAVTANDMDVVVDYFGVTLQCPENAFLGVHRQSPSILTTTLDQSTVKVEVPLDWAGYIALDCLFTTTTATQTPPPLADLIVIMESDILVPQCHNSSSSSNNNNSSSSVRLFAQFLRGCGGDYDYRTVSTRASAEYCGPRMEYDDDFSDDGNSADDVYSADDYYGEIQCEDDGQACFSIEMCWPVKSATYDLSECPGSPNPQDVSFLDAIEEMIESNVSGEFERVDYLSRQGDDVDDIMIVWGADDTVVWGDDDSFPVVWINDFNNDDSNKSNSSNSSSWYSQHGVALGSHFDCPTGATNDTDGGAWIPGDNAMFTLQCPKNAIMEVRHISPSIRSTPLDKSTVIVEAPLDWVGYIALDCLFTTATQTPPPLADLILIMDSDIYLPQCHNKSSSRNSSSVRLFAHFLRGCGGDDGDEYKIFPTRATADYCGPQVDEYTGDDNGADDVHSGDHDYGEIQCVGDQTCFSLEMCWPEPTTTYDLPECPASPNPQDLSFLHAIEEMIEGNVSGDFERVDYVSKGKETRRDVSDVLVRRRSRGSG